MLESRRLRHYCVVKRSSHVACYKFVDGDSTPISESRASENHGWHEEKASHDKVLARWIAESFWSTLVFGIGCFKELLVRLTASIDPTKELA